jgi:hypothetical protein
VSDCRVCDEQAAGGWQGPELTVTLRGVGSREEARAVFDAAIDAAVATARGTGFQVGTLAAFIDPEELT